MMFNIFKKVSVGIDIADHTIEVAELVKRRGEISISGLGRAVLEPGIVERGRIKDEKKLAKTIKKALAEAKPKPIIAKKIVFSLPQSQVYIHIFSVESKSYGSGRFHKNELGRLVLEEVQTNIPLESDDILFSYKALLKGAGRVKWYNRHSALHKSGKAEILLVAASKQVVAEWKKFFQKLKIKINIFDIEIFANFRGLLAQMPKIPVCVLDIGAVTTKIAIFDQNGLRYSYSINVAGDTFTWEIAKALEITKKEAEDLKIQVGLSDKDNRTYPVLIKQLEEILREVEMAINFFQHKTKQNVEGVILVGGSSRLKGLIDYFSKQIGLPVVIGESILFKKQAPIEYIEAIGLALRGLNPEKWNKSDPSLRPLKAKESKIVAKKSSLPEKKKRKSFVLMTSETNPEKRSRSKKIALILILIIGIEAVGLTFFFRRYEIAARKERLESQIVRYTKVQSFNLKVLVAVDESEYADDRVRGRIFSNIIRTATNYRQALISSKRLAKRELKKGERMWGEPTNKWTNEVTNPPFTFKWLIYSDQEANKLLLKEADELNKNKIKYALNNIKKTNIESTNNPNLFYLTAKVTLSLNRLIKVDAPEIQIPRVDLQIKDVEKFKTSAQQKLLIIKNTSTGWLNAREGPGTDYFIITRVYPGESYPQLEESKGWYKIKITDDKEGWIFSKYADVLQ